MAKRNRYRELENLITKVILGDIAVFVLYLLFAWKEILALKVITAILVIVVSLAVVLVVSLCAIVGDYTYLLVGEINGTFGVESQVLYYSLVLNTVLVPSDVVLFHLD